MMHLHLPTGSEVFGDAGYTDYEQEQFYAEREQIYWQIQRRSNSQRPDQAWEAASKKGLRQSMEEAFSQITMRLPKKNHAVTQAGFLIKMVLFLLAYALETNL